MASLTSLAYLACPIGMGAMMWMMMRPNKDQTSHSTNPDDDRAELQRLRQEVEQLKSGEPGGANPRP